MNKNIITPKIINDTYKKKNNTGIKKCNYKLFKNIKYGLTIILMPETIWIPSNVSFCKHLCIQLYMCLKS